MNSPSSTAIACQDVRKTYHLEGTDTFALRGVNFEVRAGELMMLVGPSGCGKTTLISVVAGILNQDSGTCQVLGQEMALLSDKQRTKFRGHNIGFVFQSYNLIPTLTTTENVAVPLLVLGSSHEQAYERARSSLERVGLADKMNAYPRHLSGGQQQRVAIARALVHRPKIIVCDEPTAALDGENGQKIMQLFREVATTHDVTLIIVTHDNRIFHFADRIARMNDGLILDIVAGESVGKLGAEASSHPPISSVGAVGSS